MEIVIKKQSIQHKNSDTCIAHEYPSNEKDINGAVVEVKGRYPLTGRVVNKKCKELIYILRGSGTIVVDGKKISFKVGDILIISPGEKYYWDAHSTMFVASTPAWYLAQHQSVE